MSACQRLEKHQDDPMEDVQPIVDDIIDKSISALAQYITWGDELAALQTLRSLLSKIVTDSHDPKYAWLHRFL